MHINKKKIKKTNSKIKIFFIVLSLIFLFIFSFFIVKIKNKTKNLNIIKYEDVIKEINTKKNINFKNAEDFIIKNENIYGTLISLLLAKQYILNNNLDKAFNQLENSLKSTKDENLKNILRLRMSKIKIQQNQTKDAMDIINEIKDDCWKNIVENIKGDIFMKNKNINLAIKAWEKSKNFEESQTSKEIINMKINKINIK
ncbi:UPF0070 protein YfgM [Buchnera aphidicola (Protaphis terricola)]|uniref:YfgM family protein n=1 Tax=Buchnera aphidicola TaxID=9 RepID=UPI003464CB25